MLRRAFWVAPVALALAGTALAGPRVRKAKPGPSAPPPPPAAPSLIGAWQLISAEVLDENGRAALAFGPRATGLLIYERSGQMSLQIAAERPMVGTIEAYQALSPEDRVVYLDGYYAYFGDFDVDEATQTVTHRVRQSLRPMETGLSLRRRYVIEGDRLVLGTPAETHGGETSRNRLTFARFHAPA